MHRIVALTPCWLFIVLFSGAAPGPTALAQPPSEPAVTITLHSSVVQYRTLPTTVILAELADASGPKASGQGISDATGRAVVQFLPLPGARDRYVRPGDRVSLARIGARPVIVDVPDLAAGVDLEGSRIVGKAPSDAQVRVRADSGTGMPLERTVAVGPDGSWSVDVDLPAGTITGTATHDDGDHRFVVEFASLEVDVTLGARIATGRGTPGNGVSLRWARPDGSVSEVNTQVVDGLDWSATLPVGGIRQGDSLTVTTSGGIAPPAAPIVADDLPEISVDIEPALDRVSGTAPAGETVVVTASALGGERVVREVPVPSEGSDAGSWSLDLSGQADLRAGWRVRAAWQAGAGLRVGRLQALPQALIGVHTAAVRGIAPPEAPVTVTLRSADGALKSVTPTRADAEGAYDARLGGLLPGGVATIESGDVVEIAVVAGDPLIVAVPELSARADVEGDRVVGRARPGSEIAVRVLSDASAPESTVTADPQGDFAAELGPAYDLARPANGIATMTGPEGTAFFTSWAAIRLSPQIGSAAFTATGPPGRTYQVRLVGPDGERIASDEGITYDFPDLSDLVLLGSLQGFFVVQFEDIAGAPVPVRSGDTIEVTAGDDAVELAVPPLQGAVFVEEDILAGRTTPNTPVSILVESMTGDRAQATAVSDDEGRFSHTFDDHDVQYNDTVQLLVAPDGHSVTGYVDVPGLVLDMDGWLVSGTVAPNKALVVTARRGADVLVEARARSDDAGAFAAPLRDPAGKPYALAAGDRIDVREDAGGGESVAMVVPELEISADSATDTIAGRATPGGALVLIVLRQVLDQTGFGVGQAWPVIEPDGSWSAVPIPSHDVRPGTTIFAQYRLAAGHMAVRSHVVPLLAVDHGTPNLCGHAAPLGAVRADLLAPAGETVASAESTVGFGGMYAMVLRDPSGAAVRSAVSQTVRADLSGTAAAVVVPEFDIQADWANQVMTGVGPADTLMLGIFPASRCPSILTDPDALRSVTYAVTDASGRFASPIPAVAPGEGVELAYQTPDGHVVFRQAYRALARAFIDTDRVTGITDSVADLALQLRASDGTELASVRAVSGPLGDFDARLRNAAGDPAAIAAGDVLVLDAAGDHAEIQIEPLSFDWGPGTAIAGRAPADRAVAIHLRMRDGAVRTIDWQVDPDGRFAFGEDDVPPRASWSWSDVVGVRVVLTTPGGHQIVSQTESFEPPEKPARATLYLPAVSRGGDGARSGSGAVGVDARPRRGPRLLEGRWPALVAIEAASGASGADAGLATAGRPPDPGADADRPRSR